MPAHKFLSQFLKTVFCVVLCIALCAPMNAQKYCTNIILNPQMNMTAWLPNGNLLGSRLMRPQRAIPWEYITMTPEIHNNIARSDTASVLVQSSAFTDSNESFGQKLSVRLIKGHKYLLTLFTTFESSHNNSGECQIHFCMAKNVLRTRDSFYNQLIHRYMDYGTFSNIVGSHQQMFSVQPNASTPKTYKRDDICFTADDNYDLMVINSSTFSNTSGKGADIRVDDVSLIDLKPFVGLQQNICIPAGTYKHIVLGVPRSNYCNTANEHFEWTVQGSSTVSDTNSMYDTWVNTTKRFVLKRTLNGCSDTASVLVRVGVTPNFKLPNDFNLCAPACSTLRNKNTTPANSHWSYIWFGNGNGFDDSLVVCKSGKYKIKVCDSSGYCCTKDTVNVTVQPEIDVLDDTIRVCQRPVNVVICVNPIIPSNFYQWDTVKTGTASMGLGNLPCFTATQEGKYYVFVQDTATGCYGWDSVVVVVDSVLRFPYVPLVEGCLPDSISLCQKSGSGFHYQWSTGQTSQCIWAKTSGWYKVYTYTNSGCGGWDSIEVRLHPRPTLHCNNLGPYCPNNPGVVLLQNCTDTGGIYSSAKGDTGVFAIGQNRYAFDILTAGPGLHKIYYTLMDSNGCESIDSFNILVYPHPPIHLNFITEFCHSDTAFYVLDTTLPAKSTISFWGDISSNGIIRPNSLNPGWYRFAYSFTDSNGCNYRDTIQYKIGSEIDGQLTADTAGKCLPGYNIKLTASVINTHNGWHYYHQWYKDNNIITGATGSTYYTNQNGHYKVLVYSDSTACTDTDLVDINLPNCCEVIDNLHGTLVNADLKSTSYTLDDTLWIQGNVTMDSVNVFARNCAIIIVERGAHLTINNSHLGYCNWKGIEVWGNIDVCASNYGSCMQGRLTMLNSVIDNAEIGVLAGGRKICRNHCGVPYSADRHELGGATITLSGDTFRNNYTDIMFSEYNVAGACTHNDSLCGDFNVNSLVFRWQSHIDSCFFDSLATSENCDTFITHQIRLSDSAWDAHWFPTSVIRPLQRCHIIDFNENPWLWSVIFCGWSPVYTAPLCCHVDDDILRFTARTRGYNHSNSQIAWPDCEIFQNNIYVNPCTNPSYR